MRDFNKSDIWPFFALCIVWFSLISIANVDGNFPLNDDWSYAQTSFNLVQSGHFKLLSWIEVSLAAQAVWGALFCLLLGKSFGALRISSLVLGLLGVLYSYLFMVEMGAKRKWALIAALTLAVDPLYFGLSCTFMTDATFTAVAVVSLYLFVKASRTNSRLLLGAATLVSIFATLIRQYGLLLPAAFLCARVLRSRNRNLLTSSMPLLANVTALGLYECWLAQSGNLPRNHPNGARFDFLVHDFINHALHPFHLVLPQLLSEIVYCGLMLTPLVVPLLFNRKIGRKGVWLTALVVSILFTTRKYANHRLMPWVGNIFAANGMGPLTLRDVFVLQINIPSDMPLIGRLIATFVGAYAGIHLLFWLTCFATRLLMKLKAREKIVAFERYIFLFVYLAMYSFLITFHGSHFERYFLPLLAPLMGLLAPLLKSSRVLLVSLTIIATFAVFTVSATHDYFEWNRARWTAISRLLKFEKISAKQIDGGFEFNGMYCYDDKYVPASNPMGRSWWWVLDDMYVVSFGPIPGYHEIQKFPYSRWLTNSVEYILVLERN